MQRNSAKWHIRVEDLKSYGDLQELVAFGEFTQGFIGKGMACATFVINCTPLSPNKLKSSHELLLDEKPSVKNFEVFGSPCYVHVPSSKNQIGW